VATNAPAPLIGHRSGQIPLGRVAFDHVMAADEIERANKAAVTTAIAKAAFYPTLAITEKLQQQVQDFDGFCGVARVHDDASRSG
jgi:hypothetical protein